MCDDSNTSNTRLRIPRVSPNIILMISDSGRVYCNGCDFFIVETSLGAFIRIYSFILLPYMVKTMNYFISYSIKRAILQYQLATSRH